MNRRSFLSRVLAAIAAPFVARRAAADVGPWRNLPTPFLAPPDPWPCIRCGDQAPDDGGPMLCEACRGYTPCPCVQCRCPLVFRSQACGYTGTAASCDKTIDACLSLGNASRFQGRDAHMGR